MNHAVPIRICCGRPHSGVVCPDGLVMCCLCFERVPVTSLHSTEDGALEDVCLECARSELMNHTIRGWNTK